MKKFWYGGALLLAAGTVCGAEILLAPSSVEDFSVNTGIKQDAGGNLLPLPRVLAITEEMVPVDPAKSYRISFEYKNGDDNSGNARGTVVAVPYEARGRRIMGVSVANVVGSESKVLEDINPGDTRVVLESNQKWLDSVKKYPNRRYAVFFRVSPQYSDMPNFTYAFVKSQGLDEEGRNVVEFTGKFPLEVKAGTLARLHFAGWQGVGEVITASDEWQTKNIDISGESTQAVGNKWWKGTKSARLGISGDPRNGGNQLLIRNLKLEEL